MTTAERTMYMFNKLSEKDQLDIQNYVENIFRARRKSKYDLKPISEKEFLEMIDRSEEDIKAGRVIPWEQVREETRRKYGI